MMNTPMGRYLNDVNSGVLVPDPVQKEAVTRLERCFSQLVEPSQEAETQPFSFAKLFHTIFAQKAEPKQAPNSLGCYLWGGVGRGKTHLMDYFYSSIPPHLKAKRTHFHRFMREIHDTLHALSGVANPLEQIARQYAIEFDVICLDEFVVIDITDAMILGGLTESLFRLKVVLVTTSNAAPHNLYKDGLQRARFLPTITHLEQNLDIFHLASENDYRLRHLQRFDTYKVLSDGQVSSEPLHALYKELVNEAAEEGTALINGRSVKYQAEHNDVIWFDFLDICGAQRSVADYIELAQEYHTVLLSGVPLLTREREDQSRRFVHLVDEFYDCKVKLFITAQVPILELYQGTRLAFEFERTESRLIEMQSQDYLGC